MTSHQQAKKFLITGTALLALAVLIGAFGAHGLRAMVTPDKLVTFETGVRYHFYHAFALLFAGVVQQLYQDLKLNVSFYAFLLGILLFSFNCYLYVVTGIKLFALMVPVGGVTFVVGWLYLMMKLLKLR